MVNILRTDTIRLKEKPKKLVADAWTIYLWRKGDKYEGASPVVTTDGIKEVYCFGWEIEKVEGAKRNEEKHQAWRAKVNVKNLLNNTLNVINWYGKKVLDSKGNIDVKRYQAAEANTALLAIKQGVDMADLYQIKKFPVKEISFEEAKSFKFTK
jgi:hypothetical protein